ncbi:AT-hook motif nuclear-localized protein 10-like [Lycium barbarum]|uniref:AT-hook motif nuclear-localized protein 10-like n=1 Tax=Lycium barbarum TaxID=112863 RepID=UPI00293EDD18|nr:AT-hook motif nuclear-localized protein 10-like [Lycium barbarum]
MSFAESNGAVHMGSSVTASDGGTTPYYPIMPPISSSPPPPPTEKTYQVPIAGVSVSGDAAPVSVDPTIEQVKRKRGRPRKYAPPDGIISPLSLSAEGGERRKGRGRPPGSGRKQQLPDLGSAGAGIGFRPHVITLKAGEDVLAKLTAFSQSISQAVCILSANGSISNVTLQQAAISGGTVTYEGQFEILSLSGYFLSESGGERSRTGGLSVLLAGPDGHVLGGGVAGVLTAASAVQVIVGSFGMEGQKQLKLDNSDAFGVPSALVFGASTAKSSSSLGTVSESSGEPVSPHNQLAEASNNSPPVVANNLPWR